MGDLSLPSSHSSQPINLLRGWPNTSLLPVSLIAQAAQKALSSPSTAHAGLLYGPDPGHQPLRVAIAAWLSSFYQPTAGEISADRLAITGGASQNMGCVLGVYTDVEYTRNVWIVAPAYFLAFRIFEDAGFGGSGTGTGGKMRAVPEDEGGVDLEFLEREMERSEELARERGNARPRYKPERKRAKVYKHVIYCVPTFANPSSRTMSLERREGLVRIARKYDALIIADDVYDFLQWPAETDEWKRGELLQRLQTAHLPRLVDVDRELDGGAERAGSDGFGNVCSNGSFSKIAGPGIRVGWTEGTSKFTYGVSQAGTTCSGGAPSQLTSTYVTDLLTTGNLQNHIKTVLQPAYASRYAVLLTAIETHLFPLGFSLPQSGRDVVGGYFVWLGLPEGLLAVDLARRCREEDEAVIVAPGESFEVPGDVEGAAFPRSIRLCFAWEEEWKLEEGVRRIAVAARHLLEGGGGGEEGGVGRDQSEGMDDFK